MANDKYIIELGVDSAGGINNIEKVKESIAQTETVTKGLKQQLREMQKQLQELDPNSKAFNELSKKAGDLKDKINDASEAVRANAGNAFESLSNNVGNLGSRLVSLDFEGVGQSFRGIAGAVGNVKMSDLTNQVKGAVGGFAQLGKTLLANPIFLLVRAIGAIIANFGALKELIDVGVNPSTREFVAATEAASAASKEAFESFGLEERRLRALGVAEADIAAQRKKATVARIESLKSELIAQSILLGEQQKANEKANAQKAVGGIGGLVASLFAPSDEDVKATNDNFKNISKQIEELNIQVLEVNKKEIDAKVKGATVINTATKATRDLKIDAERKALEAAQKATDEVTALNDKLFAEVVAEFEAAEKAKAEAAFKANQQRIETEDAQFELERQLNQTEAEKEIADVVSKYEKLYEIANGNADLEKQLEIKKQEELQDIKDAAIAKDVAAQKLAVQQKLSLTSDAIGVLIALNDSFTAKNEKQAKKQFQINKVLQIAQALINTYQGATAAYAQTPGGPVARAIAAGIAVVSGLAQVNKIRNTQFGGSSGGGGGSSSPSINDGAQAANGPPSFNPLGGSILGNRQGQIAPSYVLAGQVNTAMEVRNKVEQQARL